MNERIMQFRVGVLVVSTLIISLILTLLFGYSPEWLKDTYEFKVHFPQARGVDTGTPVRHLGVLIGQVETVEFDPEGGVLVTVEVETKYKIDARRRQCIIRSSLLGEVELDFVEVPDANPRPRIAEEASQDA